jgi:hypothetical protein
VILTFPKLQRLSGLTKPTAVKAWLKREGVSYIKDAKGQRVIESYYRNQALGKEFS